METQDSIDIAKLQRVALGLEHEPSQSSIPGQTKLGSISKIQSTHANHVVNCCYSDDSPTAPRQLSSTSNTASSQKRTSPPLHRHHEQDSMNSSSQPIKSVPISGLAPAAMDPANNPSDTQVVSQSIYDSIIQRNGESSMYGGGSQSGADGATLMTLHEGDSGHIDLLAEFGTAHHEADLSPIQDEESNYDPTESSPMAYQPEFFPESQRFLAATPGTAMKKPQTPGTSMETPTVSRNPLAGDIESSGGLMGLSQLFKATQAPSSPLVHGQLPEIVSDRPSPNIPIQCPRIINNISSPLVQFARESSEPNLNYISMKESQSRRDKSLGERLTRSADDMHSDDPIEQEFNKESSFVKNARRQRLFDEETAAQFAALNAPSRSENRATSPAYLHVDETAAAGSEEETEQEDEIAPQVLQSQEHPPSSEEDKENYNGPLSLVHEAGSAHDRLSQALAMESEPASRVDAGPGHDIGTYHVSSVEIYDRDLYSGRSSQVMVKDSQQSPPPSPRPSNYEAQADLLSSTMQPDPAPVNIGNVNISPIQQRLLSSPPPSRPDHRHDSSTNSQRQGSEVDMIQTSSNENARLNSSNPHVPLRTGLFSNNSQGGTGNKPSMLSRITETPIHLRRDFGDMARLTSIPETSPSRTQSNEWEAQSNGDGMNNEDDDLPPMLPAANAHRLGQVRHSQSRALSSPIKTLVSQTQSQILSSPSGRQRRALTEIASDCSPQIDFKIGDIGMDFFTADDEFNSLVIDGSPTRPRKKRRGNLGQSFNTSDTAIPATPRAQPPKTTAPIHESPAQQISSVTVHVPAITRRQSRPAVRDEDLWEIGDSPQQPAVRRRSRHSRVTAQDIGKQSMAAQKPVLPAPTRPVVAHKPGSTTSSELTDLTDVDIDSEDRSLSDFKTVNSPPTTPRPTRASDNAQIAPRQVIAVWRGLKRAYYPATCFGTPLGVPEANYVVKFEDSLPVEVLKGTVKRFELRIGDGVKVDMPNIPKVTHIVRGFDDKLTREELSQAAEKGFYPQTDIYGHTTIILGPKQRKSLPNGGLHNSENVIKVPIGRIYLDTSLWNHLKDRDFTYEPEPAPRPTASHSPEKSSLPASPSTRFSRSIQSASGIFANMAFAVSYTEDDGSKNRVLQSIRDNGGSILHDGFTELFEASSILPFDVPARGDKDQSGSLGLRLTALAENVGFACLIADTHSRREKYMQALALGLPCLSGRWVEDCVAKGRIIDWDVYLLPAGDSTYLNGATKSRMMMPTSPADARLSETIATRPKLLDGKSVLIVTGRGKAEKKRRAYVFLTFALGASRVERVPDLKTAQVLMESQSQASLPCSWDLIYVDDADQASAQSMLTPRPKTQRISLVHGKKRKLSAVFTMTNPVDDSLPTARVVGNEFVCQSLILGRLFEE
ncbi:hypothetical protein N7520_007006 [Penicillium odoratum]|uniref:uncharacterized protein n=1 Tax=Penicillium odoratum TaxID=1167516 RepID=UPI002547BB84|nr:uncharacterized protein N7520_007006 [Penicillium odoratum]KAJ5759850.1 hypothetical protein N7520_007006 [Penicillium odoratum]